jgi:hypothetical protein
MTFNTPIIKNGTETMITLGLSHAFRRLRKAHQTRTLWIDQLCIDQSNEQEKSEQVSIMKDIYKASSQGVIWLGELPVEQDEPGFTHQDAEMAFDHLALFDPELDQEHRVKLASYEDIDKETRARLGQVILAMMGSRHAVWQGVQWWQRIWTVQEAKLPQTSSIQWGHLSVSFCLLKRISIQMTQDWNYCEHFSQSFSIDLLNEFCTPLVDLQIQDATGLLGSLYRWRPRKATDAHDKIFGLMGLFPNQSFDSIPFCDYSMSVVDLYKLVTLDLIRQNRGLLPLVGRRGEARTTPGLPTWVLDWVPPEDPARRSHDYFGNCRRWQFFDCSAATYVDPLLSEHNSLVLRGCMVDEIQVVAPVQYVNHRLITDEEYDAKSREIARDFRRTYQSWLETHQSNGYYLEGSSITAWDAFRRTLIGDMHLTDYESDHRASAEEAASVDAQLEGQSLDVRFPLRDMVCSQSFFITKAGYIGIGPPDADVGDQVWVLLCGNYPHVLRALPATGKAKGGFEHVGDAYVHGIMDGEACRNGKSQMCDVTIY